MTPDQFVQHFHDVRASAILRTDVAEAAAPAMEAAVRSGFTVIEFTLNTPGALALIERFAADPTLVVGAGTVLTADDAHDAVRAGARFLVSPVTDEAVIEAAATNGVAMMPGTFTATEMLRAHRAGAQLQKLFPAPGIGPSYVKAIRGPMPFLRIVPTSGVHLNNAAAFLKAGAWALGFVAPLFDPNDMAQGRFDRIEERGRALLESVRGNG